MEYLTVEGSEEARYEIKKSVFIGRIKGINSYDEGMDFVKRTAKEFPDATHNCYAVITRSGEQKFSDDGEPQGTAGQPILQTLKRKGLTDVACVVTRYFGGIKLGASGLTASYAESASLVADKAEKALYKESRTGFVEVDYALYRPTADKLNALGTVTGTDFSSGAKIYFAIPTGCEREAADLISALTAGKAEVSFGETKFIKYTNSLFNGGKK